MFGVMCVRLEMLPFAAAASATAGKLAECGTRGITLLPPATAAEADETGFTLEMRAVGAADCRTEHAVVDDVCERHASSLALLLPA